MIPQRPGEELLTWWFWRKVLGWLILLGVTTGVGLIIVLSSGWFTLVGVLGFLAILGLIYLGLWLIG